MYSVIQDKYIVHVYIHKFRLYAGSRVVCGPLFLIMVLWRKGSEVGICKHLRTLHVHANVYICTSTYITVEHSASPVVINTGTPTRIIDIVLIKNQKGT